ncbi:MAG: type VI secretion system tube protein Hcp [Bacteroidetes bacterium]|nr:type VI secretion system tube protein Hcp [Bacteroidota bacterium]
MSYDVFIKIDNIEGESGDAKHVGWIEVTSYGVAHSQNISSTASSAGGASAERADFSEFTFSKLIDKASPLLTLACASGTHIDNITVELCRAGGEKIKFMEYKLTNCIISSVTAGSKGKRFFPTEHININFGKIEWTYTLQKRQGGWAAGNIAGGWNLEKNARV